MCEKPRYKMFQRENGRDQGQQCDTFKPGVEVPTSWQELLN